MSKARQVLMILSVIGSIVINLLGGWDTQLQTMIILMALDVITGTLIAMFWNKSPNSTRGAYDTQIAFKGGMKKLVVFVAIAFAVLVDKLFVYAIGADDYVRTSVILYYSGVEGASLVENLGIMGIPLPSVIINAFETLQDRGRNGDV